MFYKKENIPVVCIETGKIYKNIAQAEKETNMSYDKIKRRINKKEIIYGDLNWRKATEKEWEEYKLSLIEPIIQKLLNNKELMNKIQEYNKNNNIEI